MTPEFWKSKRVLITGHTGFKGSWLSLLLSHFGAEVFGIALDPPTEPSLYECARGVSIDNDYRCDLRKIGSVKGIVRNINPDIVFHLAAQPIVISSYKDPVGTLAQNIMGTVHLLDALRETKPQAIVVITTDKVYEDAGIWPYRENDRLGGHDPYSASKACVELVVDSYRKSFFREAGVRIATARAGNVIGGGDFGEYRIVPDIVRAWLKGEGLKLRHPGAVRPWQHVLEPLHGYLLLAERLCCPDGDGFEEGWNFGPATEDVRTVSEIVVCMTNWLYGGAGEHFEVENILPPVKETDCLLLDSTKARRLLEWKPEYDALTAVSETAKWYRAWHAGCNMREFTLGQIRDYFNDE